ncbi:hypothetical protein CCGE525_14665 [Rhizobium jaguaris]|uniref:Uncharacterized protein n=1 Tax=Rhizobium jaguaris TaxID=1312183 RepID=A0A387FNG2_9HYPH|nr:hypothetical protein CCGE525_14665 [Rhizobium jaguaris]
MIPKSAKGFSYKIKPVNLAQDGDLRISQFRNMNFGIVKRWQLDAAIGKWNENSIWIIIRFICSELGR